MPLAIEQDVHVFHHCPECSYTFLELTEPETEYGAQTLGQPHEDPRGLAQTSALEQRPKYFSK